jgi:hypothetical protein
MLFSGGLGDLNYDSRLMRENEARIALNVDLRQEEGALHAARANLGVKTLSAKINKIHKYLNSFLVHSGSSIYYNNLANSVRSFSNAFPMDILNFEGKSYLCNGSEFLKFNGTTFSTPYIEPPSSAGITATEGTSGNLEEGKYRIKFAWRTSELAAKQGLDRDESPPSVAIEVTISADKQIDYGNLPSQTNYNLVIYRWRLGTGNLYREVTEITDEATSYSDNLTYWELGSTTPNDYETPPIPRHLVVFNNNLFIFGISSWEGYDSSILDNYVFYSDNLRFSGWSRKFIIIVGKTDDRVMNGMVLGETLLIYTKKTIERIVGTGALAYGQSTSTAATGLAAEWALVNTAKYGHLFLGSDRRLHLFNGLLLLKVPALHKMDGLFDKNSDHIHRMNWSQRDKCRLTFFDDMARLAYPSGDSPIADKVLNMDFKYYPDIRFTISDYEATNYYADEINNILYVGDSDGNIKEVEGADTYLAPFYKTKDFDNGDIHADEDYEELLLDYDSKGKDISASIKIDDQLNSIIIANKDGREVVERTDLSFKSSAEGKRISVEYEWNAPNDDVVIYDQKLIPSSQDPVQENK